VTEPSTSGPPRPNGLSKGDLPYFRQLWNQVVAALLLASFVPLLVIGGGMYLYASQVFVDRAKQNLVKAAAAHRAVIDTFLAERKADLEVAAQTFSLEELVQGGRLEQIFEAFNAARPALTDLGVIDAQGRHLAYVGPYDLKDRNYRQSDWFIETMAQGAYVSDFFLGFRQSPHFIIAVRRGSGPEAWILRATVDPQVLSDLVADFQLTGKARVFLVDRLGRYQTQAGDGAALMADSGLGRQELFEGARLTTHNGLYQVKVWLDQAPWLCVAQVSRKLVSSGLGMVRLVIVFVLILSAMLILLVVLLVANRLVGRLETKKQLIADLGGRLERAGGLSASMRLSRGHALEVRDTLININAVVQWLEAVEAERGPGPAPGSPTESETGSGLTQIRDQTTRALYQLDRLLAATRPGVPALREVDLNALLDDLLEPMNQELELNRINLERDYRDQGLFVFSDPGRLRQVFENLLLNALAAVQPGGSIGLRTEINNGRARVAVQDTGPGLEPLAARYIFDPDLTTHPRGSGLGLPLCRTILYKLGGGISLENRPGQGATFIVELPLRFGDEADRTSPDIP